MPIVEVTHDPRIPPGDLERLAATLPDAVSLAVECPEEPYDGNLQPGDVEIRFRVRSQFDVSGLDIVVDVHSKWFESRAEDRQVRCDRLRDVITHEITTASVGVFLRLPVAAWSQCDFHVPMAQEQDSNSPG